MEQVGINQWKGTNMDTIHKLDRMFKPESVALIGASSKPYKWGFVILHNIKAGGYQGRVYPINPKEKDLLGYTVYPDLASVPDKIDLAIIAVPKDQALRTVEDCVSKGVGAIYMITAGFSEVGEEGRAMERRISEVCREAGIPLGGPNGQGIFSTGIRLYAQMAGYKPDPGKISLVSQSGNVASTVMHMAMMNSLGMSKFVSSGNEGALKFLDYMEYLGDDDETGVLALYLEGLRAGEGRRFIELSKRISAKKPVVLLKGGETSAGAQAAASHTAAMTAESELFDAACRQSGVVKVQDIQHFFDVLSAFATQPVPKGKRVAILTVGGGWGVLAADMCEKMGLELAKLSEETIKKLDEHMPDWWPRSNPVDSAGGARKDTNSESLRVLLDAPEVDSVIVCGGAGIAYLVGVRYANPIPEAEKHGMKQLAEMLKAADMDTVSIFIELAANHRKPVILTSDTILSSKIFGNEALEKLEKAGLITYPTPERAARALAMLTEYAGKRM